MERSKRNIKNRLFRASVILAVLAIVFSVPATINAEESARLETSYKCGLTVKPYEPEDSQLTANTVIDIYLVATASKDKGYDSYSYTLTSAFSSLDLTKSWDEVAEAAGAIFFNNYATLAKVADGVDAGTEIQNLEWGLYLVVARGKELENYIVERKDVKVTLSQTSTQNFYYAPSLVSLPTKIREPGEGEANTADPTPWIYNPTIILKPEIEDRYGDLIIIKELNSYKVDEEVTFAFYVTYDEPGVIVAEGAEAKKIKKVFNLNFKNKASSSVTVKHLPAGTKVSVEEFYNGLTYKLAEGEITEKETTIIADQAVTVTFVNEYVPSENGGYGILNTFQNSGSGWKMVPKKDSSDPVEEAEEVTEE